MKFSEINPFGRKFWIGGFFRVTALITLLPHVGYGDKAKKINGHQITITVFRVVVPRRSITLLRL
jgi:hypothetical protein